VYGAIKLPEWPDCDEVYRPRLSAQESLGMDEFYLVLASIAASSIIQYEHAITLLRSGWGDPCFTA